MVRGAQNHQEAWNWGKPLMGSNRANLLTRLETQVQGYGNAVIDPREYPRDSQECKTVSTMAAAFGGLPQGRGALVQATDLYEGEDEFARE